jgi:hypothetical protein
MKRFLSSIIAVSILLSGLTPTVFSQTNMNPGTPDKQPTLHFDVISDIQGDLGDFKHVLQDISKVNPKSEALIVNGDVTSWGLPSEYSNVKKVINSNPHPRNVWYNIGNHEFYAAKLSSEGKLSLGTWPNGVKEQEMFQRFLKFSSKGRIYYKKELNGYPFLFLGTEKYMHYYDSGLWDQVYLSDQQLNWLKENVEYYTAKDKNKPIFIFSHHVLLDTVSGSRQYPYLTNYLHVDKLYDIVKDYPQVIFFTSHSHWDLTLPDWAGKKKIEGGDLLGFTVVNTGGIENGWISAGPNGGEKAAPDGASFKQGLQVSVQGNNVIVHAYDYRRDKVVQTLTIHNGTMVQNRFFPEGE